MECYDSIYTKHTPENSQIILSTGVNNEIIMGDVNGKVRNDIKRVEICMGKGREKMKNNKGERIINLRVDNDLVISKGNFKHNDLHTRE